MKEDFYNMENYTQEDYIKYRIERAKETISEVRIHIDNKLWNTAINRMYYACFYAVSALLSSKNINITSHAGLRQKFGEYFVKTGVINRELAKHFTELSEKRHKGDYNDFYDYDENTVKDLYPTSQKFVNEIEKLLISISNG
ncbi:MAG: HEPN domain-containing protein [Prolixibacteraceae bacterium]|nr:HEPN domain-containing protein [Prolixibacteraceae bacterium]MBN2649762.1 HEPN domain-containing protein [Prolixibacteraceae bacterium]